MWRHKSSMIVLLHNIRSTYNVGAILRTAEGFGVEEVVFSGYTPRPHDPDKLPYEREKIDRQIRKVALGAEEMVKISSTTDFSKLRKLRKEGYIIVGLENNIAKPTVSLREVQQKLMGGARNDPWKKISEGKVILVLGEEVDGISPELYDEIDLFVEIPMKGRKESFNVSVAAGIAMYALSGFFGKNTESVV